MLQLYSYELVDDEVFQDFYNSVKLKLPADIYQKIQSLRFSKDRQRSLIADLLIRKYYLEKFHVHPSELSFIFNEHEKPLLKDIDQEFFNASHSGSFVVVAFSNRPVGIDVEEIRKDRRAVAERFFTSHEIEDMKSSGTDEQQIHYFFQLWTLKESYMKAIGSGMSMSLSSFSFQKKDQEFSLAFSKEDKDWYFYSELWKGQAYLSICSKENTPPKTLEIHLNNLRNIFS